MTPSPPPNFLPRVSVLFEDLGPLEGAYLKRLKSFQSESLRRAWIDGDMRALTGMYFREFRPRGPLVGEEQYNARHVYDPETTLIEKWWHTWGSFDWGYIHPTNIQFHRKAPWGQTYTFQEISLNRVEPFELGVLIARELRPILAGLIEGPQHINLFGSPDAFSRKESEFPSSSQMARGIESVLGPNSCFLMNMEEAEKQMRSPTKALQSMLKRRETQKGARVSLVRASTDRVGGWMHLQTMMRFRPLQPVSVPDKEYADRLYLEQGLVAHLKYVNQPEFALSKEVLPLWQISKECRLLIAALQKAMHKPGTNDVLKWDATESAAGDDPIDNARYGMYSEHLQGTGIEPIAQRIERRVEAVITPGMSEHTVDMARRRAQWVEEHPEGPVNHRPYGHNRVAIRRSIKERQAVLTARGARNGTNWKR